MYALYGHPRYFRFKRKYQQYSPCFQIIFSFLMTMLWPMLNKTSKESNQALVISPLWPTQTWFNKLLESAIDQPIIIESNNNKYLMLSGTNKNDPLYPKLKSIAVLCPRIRQKQVVFRTKLITSSTQRGETNINILKNTNASLNDKRKVLQWKRN